MSNKKTSFESLSDKRKLFVSEYVMDLDGTRAAREAKYNRPNEAASRMLKDKTVAAAIKELLAPTMAANQLTKERVVEQLSAFLFRSIKDFVGDDGFLITSVAKLPDSVAQCVESWEVEDITEWDDEAHERITIGQKVKVKLVSKSKMQELAMKYCGLLKPEGGVLNVNVNGNFDWKQFYMQQNNGTPEEDVVERKLREVEGDSKPSE